MAPKLTIRQTATHLGVDPRTVRRYIADGRLTAYRVGPRAIRIKAEDVEKLLRPIPTTDMSGCAQGASGVPA